MTEQNGKRPWMAEEDDLLGTMSDKDLARRLGRSTADIFARRRLLGIKAWAITGRPPRRLWTPQEDALLGTMTDAALAAKLGISMMTVYERRRKLFIPSFRQGRPPAK